jgi:uncharacterized protein
MIELLERQRKEVERLCRHYRVARLEVFGSAADGTFDAAHSDIDFLVEFRAGEPMGPWLSRFTSFQEALQGLLGRPVDLVMPQAMQNPYFIREVNRSRVTLYAA